jgi:DNA-binding NtrC family response regulator
MAKTILVVDDDPTQRRLIGAVLEREGFAVAQAESGRQALDRLAAGGAADAVVLDWVMPGMSGLETLAEIRARHHNVPVVILTAKGGVDTVVQAMTAGAQDFFVKPASPERIIVSIRNVLQMGDLTKEVGRLKKVQSNAVAFDDLVGDSVAMRTVKRMGERGAKSGAPILILGESGVGKELIARAVHGASDRAGKAFVAVNCGALPENLVESILFGHEKGSFTGATDKHSGKFQEATAAPCSWTRSASCRSTCRSSCLRALQEGEIDPVGSKRSVKVDVADRLATNRDLASR